MGTTLTWKQDFTNRAGRVSKAIIAGFAMGGLIGGLGGRLAMFVLRLTSAPSLHGRETDDGFTIGVFSRFTLFLVMVTAILGMLGAIAYLAVRAWLPPAWRTGLTGLFGAIVGGAGVIRPDGIDFTLLDPLPVAVVMFIALPAIYGVAMSRLIEHRLEAESAGSSTWWLGLVPLVPLAVFGPLGIALVLTLLVLFVIHRAAPGVAELWRSPVVTWVGRAMLLAVTGVASLALVRDVADVL